MLAKTRPYFLLACLALSACVQVAGQSPGSSYSATSFGIAANPASAGRTSLASLGPNGFPNSLQPFLGNCCAISLLSPPVASEVRPPLAPEYGRRRHDDESLVPVAVPVYIPYAIGYEPDESEATAEESDIGEPALAYGPGQAESKPGAAASDDSNSGPSAADEVAAPVEPPEPVTPQPATVLVYKDGHRAQVVNYAILGDALFDFDDEHTSKIPLADLDLAATEKVNDAAGVDFKLPASMIRNTPN